MAGLILLLIFLLIIFSGARQLPEFLRDLVVTDSLNQVFYTTVELLGTPVDIPRPVEEARSELNKLIQGGNRDALLYRLLAEQDERGLDMVGAEKHYQDFVEFSPGKASALGELADFYERMQRWEDCIKTLQREAELASSQPELPLQARPRYLILHHAIDLIESRQISRFDPIQLFRQLVAWFPDEPLLYQETLAALLKKKQHDGAIRLLEDYQQRFPKDREYAITTRARLFEEQGNTTSAMGVYDQNYDPRWSDPLVSSYMDLLRRSGRYEQFVQTLGEKLKQDPLDFRAVTLLFRGLLSQGRLEEARAILFRFRVEKEARQQNFTEDELDTIASYFASLHHFNEAARYYSTLYLFSSDQSRKEESLFQLYEVLLEAQNRPTQLGGGSLEYYRTVTSVDAYPGFLNGILSLVLNRSHPQAHYREAEEQSVAYFNRRRSAEILEVFEKTFPASKHLPRMQYQALEVLKGYGQWETIVQHGRRFLDTHVSTLEAPSVGILVADALAQEGKQGEELETYRRILEVLNQRPHKFAPPLTQPAGSQAENPDVQGEITQQEGRESPGEVPLAESQPPAHIIPASIRSPEEDRATESQRLSAVDYTFVLERYVSRLTSAKRFLEAAALFRHEMEKNPSDESLCARFAEYLDQHRFFQEEMEIYQQAVNRFNGPGWYDKLARWYLRRKRQADFAALSRKFIDTFKGTPLEEYFQSTVSQVVPTPFYEELNLYARHRFPHNRIFARNLVTHYAAKKRWTEWEELSRQCFFDDVQIRQQYLQRLTETGRLDGLAAGLAALNSLNPAQERFLADAYQWRSDFEQAVGHYQKLAKLYPTDAQIVSSSADILRSLGYQDLRHYRASAELRENLARFNPGDIEVLTRIGETYADTEEYDKARQSWSRIPLINMSDPRMYLEQATLLWDYYQYNDSLQAIETYRRLSQDPNAMAYEAGAIFEDQRSYARAIEEYVNSASTQPASNATQTYSETEGRTQFNVGDVRAFQRLRFLSRRKDLSPMVDAQFTKTIQEKPRELSFALAFVRYLKESRRLEDLRQFLLTQVNRASDREFFNAVLNVIQEYGFYESWEAGLIRLRSLSSTPEQGLALDIELAHFLENRNRLDDARRLWEKLYSANPKSVGLIRDLESFYWGHDLQDQALGLLERSMAAANANYREQFTFDLAQKALELKRFDQSVELAKRLLSVKPLDVTYSSFMAQALAQASRLPQLLDFYKGQLEVIRSSDLSPDDKKLRIIGFRRGMIEAQVHLQDFPAALDQYIEIINADAEDAQIVNEAAGYAQQHQLDGRLRSYYSATATQSPKDYRWPLVLARMEERWGRLHESVQQYDAAIRIRPERQEFYEAKVSLQQRLLEFPAAIETLQHLHERSYGDSRYLQRIADLQARLGNKAVALETLKKANGTEASLPVPQYFRLVNQLNQWGMLEEAKPFIDEGWKRFTANSTTESYGDPQLLSPSVMVSVQRRDEVTTFYALLTEYRRLDAVKSQPGGNDAISNLEILHRAFLQLGKGIDYYFGPEEKSKFQAFLQKLQPTLSLEEKRQLLLPLSDLAGLPELEESTRLSILEQQLSQIKNVTDPAHGAYQEQLQQLVRFYSRRQAYDRASEVLTSLWERNPLRDRDVHHLIEPAVAARKTGDAHRELAILERYFNHCGSLYDPSFLRRYYELLVQLNQEARILEISQKDVRRIPDLINVLIDHNQQTLAQKVIGNYGKRLSPVWTRVQQAMTGFYFKDASPSFASEFSSALNLKPIGELIKLPPNAREFLYGPEWYYYAGAYGRYLFFLQRPQAADYLIAPSEFAPVSAPRQVQLGEFFFDKNQADPAIPRFENALELDSQSIPALDGQALAWMKLGQREKAVANWQIVLKSEERSFSLSNWQLLLQRIRQFQLQEAFHQPLEAFLKKYVKWNHVFQLDVVVLPALECFEPSEAKVSLLKDLARETQTFSFIEHLLQLPQFMRLNEKSRLPLQTLYAVAIESQRDHLKELGGDTFQFELNKLVEFQLKAVEFLLKNHLESLVEPILKDIMAATTPANEAVRKSMEPLQRRARFLQVQLLLQTGAQEEALRQLNAIVERQGTIYDRRDDYIKAAQLLRSAKLPEESLKVQVRLYQQLIQVEPGVNANYLGLAEAFLKGGQTGMALALVQQMLTVQIDNSDGYLQGSALLAKYGTAKPNRSPNESSPVDLQQKSREILANLMKMNPFDFEAGLRLAGMADAGSSNQAHPLLKHVLESPQSSYVQKVQAAKLAGRLNIQNLPLGSSELQILAELAHGATQAASPVPNLSSISALAYFARLSAALSKSGSLSTGKMEWLRQALYVKPFEQGKKSDTSTALFAELLKAYASSKQPRLLVDLFEQNGYAGAGYYQYLPGGEAVEEAPRGERLGEAGETESYSGPMPLLEYSLTASRKAAILKLVVKAYSDLEDYAMAAQVARQAALIDPAGRQSFDQQSVQLEARNERFRKEWSSRFSVNDKLGEEFSTRQPVPRPKRRLVRS